MIIRAKYAMPEPGVVLRDARIEIDNQRIAVISSGYSRGALSPDYDFGEAVILPGLVNPHTHLELEFCAGSVSYHGDFIAWLQEVRDRKKANSDTVTRLPQRSLGELLAAGCTSVFDHHTSQLEFSAMREQGPRYIGFREFFGFDNHQPDEQEMRSQAEDSFAPHAPYTASIEVARACRRLADGAGLPMSMHLSESRQEIEFIRSGSNASIEELLRRVNQLDPDWRGSGLSPIALYAREGLLSPQTFAIHVNYLEPGDLELLRDLRPTVVFCPRSHAYFQHALHPIETLLAAGIPVALGTDSLASNARLSPLREAELVRRHYPAVSAADVFAAMTTRALAPLGWDEWLGHLEPGYLADLAVFPLAGDPGPGFAELLDAVIESGQSALSIVDGKVMHSLSSAGAARDDRSR